VTSTSRLCIAAAALLAGSSVLIFPPALAAKSDGWESLFNGKDFTGWYTYLPSTGRNSDPKHVFKWENGMVHILDIPESDEKQEFGYLSSEREFSNCRIRVEFKWGTKRFVPNNENKRDSGLLYFFNGPDKIWPRSLEFQIQETDVGDLWILEDSRITTKVETEGFPMYVLSGPLRTQSRGRIIKFGDFEDRGGWNTLELVLDADKATQMVNGRVVMRAWDIKQQSPDKQSPDKPGEYLPVSGGRIMLQAEGAEVWFRNLTMKPITPTDKPWSPR
jgi:Domain of Unknown Function (DUF1080)